MTGQKRQTLRLRRDVTPQPATDSATTPATLRDGSPKDPAYSGKDAEWGRHTRPAGIHTKWGFGEYSTAQPVKPTIMAVFRSQSYSEDERDDFIAQLWPELMRRIPASLSAMGTMIVRAYHVAAGCGSDAAARAEADTRDSLTKLDKLDLHRIFSKRIIR